MTDSTHYKGFSPPNALGQLPSFDVYIVKIIKMASNDKNIPNHHINNLHVFEFRFCHTVVIAQRPGLRSDIVLEEKKVRQKTTKSPANIIESVPSTTRSTPVQWLLLRLTATSSFRCLRPAAPNGLQSRARNWSTRLSHQRGAETSPLSMRRFRVRKLFSNESCASTHSLAGFTHRHNALTLLRRAL